MIDDIPLRLIEYRVLSFMHVPGRAIICPIYVIRY